MVKESTVQDYTWELDLLRQLEAALKQATINDIKNTEQAMFINALVQARQTLITNL